MTQAQGIQLRYNGIYLFPPSGKESTVVQGHTAISPDWIAYAIFGTSQNNVSRPAVPIRDFAQAQQLRLQWIAKQSLIDLSRSAGSFPSNGVEDQFALSFREFSQLDNVPPDLKMVFTPGRLTVTYSGSAAVQGIFALKDTTFSPFGDNVRSPVALPDDCRRVGGRTTCTVVAPRKFIYLALRFWKKPKPAG